MAEAPTAASCVNLPAGLSRQQVAAASCRAIERLLPAAAGRSSRAHAWNAAPLTRCGSLHGMPRVQATSEGSSARAGSYAGPKRCDRFALPSGSRQGVLVALASWCGRSAGKHGMWIMYSIVAIAQLPSCAAPAALPSRQRLGQAERAGIKQQSCYFTATRRKGCTTPGL